jgi:hypothetical protein
MDEYTEVYFVDDERNARGDRDHRSQQPQQTRMVPVGQRRPRGPVVIARPAPVVQTVQPEPKGSLLGLSAGQLVELASMVLAAIMPLPAAPIVVGVATTDMTNQLAYTSALALHAKRDEQLRTIGTLVGKLVG